MSEESAPVEVDAIDRRIVRELLADGRISQRRLAEMVKLSPPSVAERVARLQNTGVIRRHTICVDWATLGYPVVAYISMTVGDGGDAEEIVGLLRQLDELETLSVVTGAYDLLARFRVRDHGHLRGLLFDSIWPIPGLDRIETSFSLGEVPIQDGGPPLSRLIDID
jgi:Lrp/AsnC family transcriptional regulator, leucine-responsive regulatory protein